MSTQAQQPQNTSLAKVETSPLITAMATEWKLSPATMISTLKATIFPQVDRDNRPVVVSNEQVVAFLQVCNEYHLNPWVKEIYAFPSKGGGIVPMVPIDGWSNIINRNPNMDGIEFVDEWETDANGARKGLIPFSTTCIIYRKDRSHPTKVTEFFHECNQPTKEPWKKWPSRMLRWKAMIQCARVAFSLGGIFDPDEAERIAETGGDEKEIISRPTRASAAPQTIELKPRGEGLTTSVAQAAVAEPTTGEASTRGSTAQHQPVSASSGCFCTCCKNGHCDCADKDDFNRCGCQPCKFNVAAPPDNVEESKTRTDEPTPNPTQPSGSELFPQPGARERPEGPYIADKARTKLIIAAKAVGWNVQKDSQDDPLHKFLKEKYAIESLREIPVSMFDHILKEVGNSGKVNMNLK